MPSSIATDELLDLLDADGLAALMRSTWTWDDRALRRELSGLLVDVAAARWIAAAADAEPDGASEAVLVRIRRRAAAFCSAVLGPRLLGELEDARMQPYATIALGLERGAVDATALVPVGRAARDRYADLADPPPRAQQSTRMLSLPLLTGLAADPLAAALLTGAAVGAGRATVAVAERGGSWDPASIRTRAHRDGDTWLLRGSKTTVPDIGTADLVLVVARTTGGPTVFAVDVPANGLVRHDSAGLDASRTFGELILDDVVARPLGRDGAGGILVGHLLDHATAALTADQLATAGAALAVAADTADLATFGALHLDLVAAAGLAATASDLLATRTFGWRTASAGRPAAAAAMAHIACSDVAVAATRFAHSVHPQRPDTETLLRRAVTDQALFGGPALTHERLLDRLGV